MQYTCYTFTLHAGSSEEIELGSETLFDLLAQHLAESGFESFENQGEQLLAYIPSSISMEPEILNSLLDSYPIAGIHFSHTAKPMPDINWNKEWEQHYFRPIVLQDERCVVRAPFHPPYPKAEVELIIQPKMAFGTGNHETTALILSALLALPLSGAKVLDMGCGTGILGILTLKRGAHYLTAIDIDDWACQNTQENALLNHTHIDEVICADASALADRDGYDLVIANIMRNVVHADMPAYKRVLAPRGKIILSGFYEDDIPFLLNRAEELGLTLVEQKIQNRWAMLILTPSCTD